jgi:hypothetical protein
MAHDGASVVLSYSGRFQAAEQVFEYQCNDPDEMRVAAFEE